MQKVGMGSSKGRHATNSFKFLVWGIDPLMNRGGTVNLCSPKWVSAQRLEEQDAIPRWQQLQNITLPAGEAAHTGQQYKVTS
eukprot:3484367-Amphidinium_carterae.1